jgi:hypothetical protein
MFTIFNENYYLDIEKLEEYVNIPNSSGESQIHLVKYEIVKNLIDVVLTEGGEIDENLGMKTSELTIPFKIAFNSLMMKDIINKL